MKEATATLHLTFRKDGNMSYVLEAGDVPFSQCLEVLNACVSDFTNRLINDVREKGMTDEEFEVAMQERLNKDAKILAGLIVKGKIITMNGHGE